MRPNVLLLHSHDTGRALGCYGAPVSTPNLDALAARSFLLGNMETCSPTCSPSRAALLTGRYPHQNGMTGLQHRGWSITDRHPTLAGTLRDAGYDTLCIGEQHIAADPRALGYQQVLCPDSSDPAQVADTMIDQLDATGRPFFASVGFWQTHRTSWRGANGPTQPALAGLPDDPVVRADFARLRASIALLDHHAGRVLNAVAEQRPDTLVIVTTDHGPGFPAAKCTLHGLGVGVMCLIGGPAVRVGRSDALLSNVDLYPTICDLLTLPSPACEGRSFAGLLRDGRGDGRSHTFSETNFHAAYDPARSVRTSRHGLIRRYPPTIRRQPWSNIDDGPTKDLLHGRGWTDRVAREELYDLCRDPAETRNVAADPAYAEILAELSDRLDEWMNATHDPLLDHQTVPAPAHAIANHLGAYSAEEPDLIDANAAARGG